MDTIGNRIRLEREARGWDGPTLAKKAGTTKQSVSQIESGKTKDPKAGTAEKISQALDVNTSWLITGRGPKSRASQSMTLDTATLAASFNLISGLLREDGRYFDLNRYADAFAVVYRSGGTVEPEKIDGLREMLKRSYQEEVRGRRDVGASGESVGATAGRTKKHR